MIYDAIIIGAGHNGLVAACYLAKSGLKTLVLERCDAAGAGIELDHAVGPFSSQVIADLNLSRFGLKMITPEARVLALSPDGQSLCKA